MAVPPCPGDTDYCLKVSFAGLEPSPECVQIISAGWLARPIVLAGVNGPQKIGGTSRALIVYRHVDDDPEYPDQTYTYIHVTVTTSCLGPVNRSVSVTMTAGTAAIFGSSQIFPRNQSVVTLTNQVVCPSSGSLNTGGSATVTILTDASCVQPGDYIVARKCSDSSVEIIVDPATNTLGKAGIEYLGDSYEPGERMDGTPVTVDWVDDVCIGATPPPAPLLAGKTTQNKMAPKRMSVAKRVDPLTKNGMISEDTLDAMGADPKTEAAKSKQGGCCGQPSKE